MSSPKRTVLYDLHAGKLGARMTEFGGFAMPVSYRGIIEEHLAVRSAAGLFDLSHMGEFEVSGPAALELLERALTNSAARLREGDAQYTILCAEDGGTIDDLIVYRLGPDRYLLCVNASNIPAAREQLTALNRGRAAFVDQSDETALIAIQGPAAAAILAPLTGVPVAAIGRFKTAAATVAGAGCLIARTGYTGEDGFELFTPNGHAVRLFEAILDAGAAAGLMPCGLGARDTLRMEAGLPLYGHELDRSTTPLEAGLGPFVKFGHGFVGEPAMKAERERGMRKRLLGIRTEDARTVARQGYAVWRDGREIGAITSGTFAPSFDRPLAIAYVAASAIEGRWPREGDALEVGVRNRKVAATVVPLPFYRRSAPRAA
jgi:glycine cleavage system T protein (aminomethyltransferase)